MPGRGDSTGMGPAANVWVTLHRLGKDSAGPVDSVRSDANGHYRLEFKPFGAPDAAYFASVTYGGIAYFAPPARSEHASGDDGEITVFDTTSRAFPLSVKGRHLIVGKRDTGNVRTIIEVFELSNDSLQTIIATGTTTPTWRVRVPGAATDARVNSDEVSPRAFRVQDGHAEIFAPVPPGVKQVSFTYHVPESAFPLAFTAEAGAVVFEILLEDLAKNQRIGHEVHTGRLVEYPVHLLLCAHAAKALHNTSMQGMGSLPYLTTCGGRGSTCDRSGWAGYRSMPRSAALQGGTRSPGLQLQVSLTCYPLPFSRYWQLALMKSRNSGCAFMGLDLNSGWN